MKEVKGVPSVGTLGNAGSVQQIGGISEQLDCSADQCDLQTELAKASSAIERIYCCDDAYSDYRTGRVVFPYLYLETDRFVFSITVKAIGGAECYQQP